MHLPSFTCQEAVQKFPQEIFEPANAHKMSEFSIQSLTGGTRFMFQHSENSEHELRNLPKQISGFSEISSEISETQ